MDWTFAFDTQNAPRIIDLVLLSEVTYNVFIICIYKDVCHGICQMVVGLAENHTKIIIEAVLSGDETRRKNASSLVQMVLVSACSLRYHDSVIVLW